ncbi:MAG: hypothetical protein QXK89_03655 [Candidatus Bathyarchaeia archaeon]
MLGMKRRKNGQTSLGLFALLLGALIIMGVGAAVYNILIMQFSQVGVEAAKVQFVTGADSTSAGASIGDDGTYVSFTSVSGWPNATRIYEDIVGIKNIDTEERAIELKFDSWSGDTSDVEYICVKVFDGSNQKGNTVIVGVSGSSTGEISIPANETWRVQLEVKWKAGASSSDKVSFTLQLIVRGE